MTRPDIISLPELKKTMQKILAEKNTESSISSESVEYYAQVIRKFIIPRICQAKIQVEEDCGPKFKHYPEMLKWDLFV